MVAKVQKNRILTLARPDRLIYARHGDRPFMDAILKKADGSDYAEPSRQGVTVGRKEHPFDFDLVSRMQLANVHHASCIHSKVAATVGLGFLSDKVFDALNDKCDMSFQDVLSDVIEDYFQCGNGYMEIVRAGDNGEITGIHHIPAYQVAVVIENAQYDRHYEIIGCEGVADVRFAAFGDLQDFRTRVPQLASIGISNVNLDTKRTSEVIHFRRSTSLSRWYGFPDWLSAVASIELSQCLHQHTYDYFLNRGVPEFLLFLIGKIDPKSWKDITDALKANIGMGNSKKSVAVNLSQGSVEDYKIQLEKLAMEGKSDSGMFSVVGQELALEIISAHRMPPLLAGIQTPGKLGANNELPNALMAFQLLVIGPAQQAISTLLGCTLGNEKLNGGLGLSAADFKLKRIVDEMNLAMMDTIARMREPLANGRDPSQGLRNDGGDSTPQATGQMMSSVETRGVLAGNGEVIAKEFVDELTASEFREVIDSAATKFNKRRDSVMKSMVRHLARTGREPAAVLADRDPQRNYAQLYAAAAQDLMQ